MQDIFYSTQKLSLKDKKKICDDAKKVSSSWNVDILDCTVSFSRKLIDMSYATIMKKLNNKSHFVVICRFDTSQESGSYGEIGFSTMDDPVYFLWIYINTENLNKLIKKYKLTPL